MGNVAGTPGIVKHIEYIFWQAMTPRLQLMLRAALLEDARGFEAWQAWNLLAQGDLTPEEHQLAPTLARALLRRAVHGPAVAALQPYATNAWLANQVNRGVAATALRQLHATGIETMVLKGTALVPAYYGDPGARRAGDVDVLVPEAGFRDAWDRLDAAGWRPVGTDVQQFDPRFGHAVQLVDGAGHGFDLHCHALFVSCERGADTMFWDAAVPLEVGGVPTAMLCPTDQLLHVCVHGQTWQVVAPVRWFADAVIILRRAGVTIDWRRFVEVARARRVTLCCIDALDTLQRVLDVAVPDDVLSALRATTVSVTDRMLFRVLRVDSHGRPLLRMQWHWARFLRGTEGLGPAGRLGQLPVFLQAWLGENSWTRIAVRLLYLAGRSVAIRLGVVSREVVSQELLQHYARASVAAQSSTTPKRRTQAAKVASRHIV